MRNILSSLNRKSILFVLITGLAFWSSDASATKPLTSNSDSLWGNSEGSLLPSAARQLHRYHQLPQRDIREVLGQFQQTCTFLDSMQDHDPQSGVFGGLHEGEGNQLWGIIESDNTQEAVRVWCEYAAYFEDPDRFRANVEDAWTYLDSFPAWEESPPENFYAMHNAGWGLVATIGYRHVYGDGRDAYGQRCAEHLIENVPEITIDMEDNLMPLVAGWSAGTLYEYGLEMENQRYRQEAIRIALQVKDWIESDPNRLNRNEIWALCGGTAMWGVMRSLVREDTTAMEWVPPLLEHMDVLSGRGNWNNSWNIWYTHAWMTAYEFFGDEEYLRNGETIIDSLLAQDTDDDGGIPATMGDPNNRDQAWVSAYTAWMGLRNLFEGLPDVDVSLLSVVAPDTRRPWPVSEELEVRLRVQQNGSMEFLSNVPINISGAWQSDQEIDLSGWEPRIIALPSLWRPDNAGEARIRIVANADQDEDQSNDTLSFSINIRNARNCTFSTRHSDGSRPAGLFTITNLEFSDLIPPFAIEFDEGSDDISCRLMEGLYRITFYPEFPFSTVVRDSVIIDQDSDVGFTFDCVQPPILIVNNDIDTSREGYFTNQIDILNSSFRLWRNVEGSVPSSDGFEVILYYTGNSTEETIPLLDQEMLIAAPNSGTSILISGQNIAEEFAGTQFLANGLHSEFLTGSTGSRQVVGNVEDEVMHGMSLLLIGNAGAANQSSTDGINSVNGATVCAYYSGRADTAAAVRWENENGSKGIFCSFGVEGISGQGGTTSRAEFLRKSLTWLGIPLSIESDDNLEVPASPLLISAYPNPFNGTICISFNGLLDVGNAKVSICDANGRLVTVLDMRSNRVCVWNGYDLNNLPVSNGAYFARMSNSNGSFLSAAIKINLIK